MERDPRTAELRRRVREVRKLAKNLRAEADARYGPIFERFDFRDMETGERITDPGHLYLTDQKDLCAEYYAACDAANREAGYDLPPGHCPALIAGHDVLKAERALLEHCGDFCGINYRDFVAADLWAKSVDLFLNPGI